jgi:sugar lactone lactonase YvrE
VSCRPRLLAACLLVLSWATLSGDAAGPGPLVGVITTIAGSGPDPAGPGDGDGGPATAAKLSRAIAIAIDGAGNLYVAEQSGGRVRKIAAATGVITTFAGGGSGDPGDGGPATAAYLGRASGLALDGAGNLFIADEISHRIRKVAAATGLISTVAGNGTPGEAGDGGPATSAQLLNADGIAVDSLGNLYIGDGNRIRMVTAVTGVITTIAGVQSYGFSGDGGPATSARLDGAKGIVFDNSGNLYFSDTRNFRVRMIAAATSVITTVAGGGSGLGENQAATTVSLVPDGLALDADGNLYIADFQNFRVRKVAKSTGLITTVAGSGRLYDVASGSGDGGAATTARLFPTGVVFDAQGNLFVAEAVGSGGFVRKVTPPMLPALLMKPVAGNGTAGFSGDGAVATAAQLNAPAGLAVDVAGNVYIADLGNHRIRKIAVATNVISTIAGTGSAGFSGDGGAAPAAQLSSPSGVTVDGAGDVYIADRGNNRIRRIAAATGVISTVAGSASSLNFGGDGGAATTAALFTPGSVAVDGAGNLYIADSGNSRIRKVTAATGIITTLAGTSNAGFSGDGGGATAAQLSNPAGIAVDGAGNLYISDLNNRRIRKITASTGVISSLATVSTNGVALDWAGHVYSADGSLSRIQQVNATTGVVTTVAGSIWPEGSSGDGGAATAAQLGAPRGVAIDTAGNVYIADTLNQRVRVAATIPQFMTPPLDRAVNVGQSTTLMCVAAGAPVYQWQSSTDAGTTWSDLAASGGFSGVTTTTLTIANVTLSMNGRRFRCGATNDIGTVYSPSATLTATVAPSLDRTSLMFAATNTGAAFSHQTPAQTVGLIQGSVAPVAWTATSNRPWLTVTPASGNGSAALSVAVRFDSSLPTTGTVSGAITVALNGVSTTVGPITVTLQLTASAPPFGSFDTPVGDGTALAGSVAVTGWALDNIGLRRVELWRDLVAGESTTPFASTPNDPRNGKVFIATPTFVAGGRPDVEALYPTTPFAYHAGWGYLLLTWGLPNQGNGAYQLYAYAFDEENNVATLGTKTILVSNNTAAKPFGAIDTPAIGGDASGPNFGWALTPRVNGVATCRIPLSGVQVSIDSGPLQPVVYGDVRSDVAGAFTGFSNSAAAGGHSIIDWTTLTTGAHAIGWLVTDDCNRADGIGSRFFNVANGTTPVTVESLATAGVSAMRVSETESDAPITVARGFGELPVIVPPGEAGSRTVEVKQGERIEMRLPRGFESAYQLARDGERRALPTGSTWDSASGIFYWQPAPGFLGRYRLVFGNGSERISVRVVVTP